MTGDDPGEPRAGSISIRVGSWFEARATGWGVAALPVLVSLIALVAGARWLLG